MGAPQVAARRSAAAGELQKPENARLNHAAAGLAVAEPAEFRSNGLGGSLTLEPL